MSHEHKPDNPEEKKRIEQAGGFVAEGRINQNLNVSRAIGDFEFKQNTDLSNKEQIIVAMPEVIERKLDGKESFFLMGCDGIWELKTEDELCELIDKSKVELKDTGEDILNKSLAHNTEEGLGCDNMTAIIVKLKK